MLAAALDMELLSGHNLNEKPVFKRKILKELNWLSVEIGMSHANSREASYLPLASYNQIN